MRDEASRSRRQLLMNEPQRRAHRDDLKISFDLGRTLGRPAWTLKMAQQMGLKRTLNPRGRPKKEDI
jgi:hypothetical protein